MEDKIYVVINEQANDSALYSNDKEKAVMEAYELYRRYFKAYDEPDWEYLEEKDKEEYRNHVFGPYSYIKVREAKIIK